MHLSAAQLSMLLGTGKLPALCVRRKHVCDGFDELVQAPAMSRPIPKSYAGSEVLANVLVSKYCDHLPLCRHSRIDARDGVELDVSTLADWVGQASALVRSLLEAIEGHVMAATNCTPTLRDSIFG